MTHHSNPSRDEMIAALEAQTARELPPAPSADERMALLDALDSDRPITVIFHGEPTMNAEGEPAVSNARVYRVGEVVHTDDTGDPLGAV